MSENMTGVFRDKGNGRKLRLFHNLTWGKMSPTDIDGFIEFDNKLFIFIEVKYGDAPLPRGQRLGLERLCDAIAESGKVSMVIIGRHTEEGDVDVANLPVDTYRFRGEWIKPKSFISIRTAIDMLRDTLNTYGEV